MATFGVEEFQAAAIYDPATPGGADRLELLEHLASRGVTLAAMVEAARFGGLVALASELPLRARGNP